MKQDGDVILCGDFNAKLELNIPEKNIHQSTSRNGEMLKELLEDTDSEAINTRKNVCEWTRENRKNPNEKSVIDYIITTKKNATTTNEVRVDTRGTHRLKGKEETDHNTILLEANFYTSPQQEKVTIWKKGTDEDWRNFNHGTTRDLNNKQPETYEELESILMKNLKKHIGQVTFKPNAKRESKEVKQLREKKKQAENNYDQACKEKPSNLIEIREKYYQTQINLRKQIENDEEKTTKGIIDTLIKEGGIKSQLFWKLRRKILRKENDSNYDTVDENGTTLDDPEEAKEHIATYYENLYQAREGTEEYKEWTEKIQKKIKELEEVMKTKEPIDEITPKELHRAIKSLKKGKSCGPDNIPNEVFMKANKEILNHIRKQMNKISNTEEIPDQWQEGEIKRLYKGKGNKGKCSAERGITLASNFGKLYERVINNRVLKEINLSDAQAGGKKGRATTDHLLIIKDIIQMAKNKRKPLYIVFLDVTKACDKAWLDAIMYVMEKEGLKSKHWSIVRKLNQNLTARIRTKHGLTRKIQIKDSIRQGGVLSVAQYAVLMDEIAKDIRNEHRGIKLPNSDVPVGSLLWVDDVALISLDAKELQDMLDTTNNTASKYRIAFGKEKSQVMVIGSKKQREQAANTKFHLGEMELDKTESYSYLGEKLNSQGDLTDQIKSIKGKVEAAFQTIQMVAGNSNFNKIEMETIWKLVETCIIPIASYASETWDNSIKITDDVNRILDNVIKRILKTPVSTPREPLYMETGLMDLEHHAKLKQIMMKHRLNGTATELIEEVLQSEIKKGWNERTSKLINDLNITDDYFNKEKKSFTQHAKKNVMTAFREKLLSKSANKSKVLHLTDKCSDWTTGKRRAYMDKLTRNQTSIIFQTRTRMLKVKENYKNKYKADMKCRACGHETESQSHILRECETLHQNETSKITEAAITTEDTDTLKETATKIEETMRRLIAEPPGTTPAAGAPADLGRGDRGGPTRGARGARAPPVVGRCPS